MNLDALLLLRTFLFHVRILSLKDALWYLHVTQCECQTHTSFPAPLDTHSVLASRWTRNGLFDRLISNQWLQPVIHAVKHAISSFLSLFVPPGLSSTSCSNMTGSSVSFYTYPLSFWNVKSFVNYMTFKRNCWKA